MNLTIIIPTLNEEDDLPRTLNSLKEFNAQVLVVDSGSIDKTTSIAKNFGCRVVRHPFVSFSDTRNFADSLAKTKWIMQIEADVVVPSQTRSEITNSLHQEEIYAFYIGRINQIWGKPILHSDWGPNDDCHIWLYRKGIGSWSNNVHEQFITTLPTGKLKHNLLHYNYKTVSEFIDKTDRYSTLAVKKSNTFLWLAPFKDFFKRYIYKLGFLDGYHGLFLAYLQAIYHVNVLVKSKTL